MYFVVLNKITLSPPPYVFNSKVGVNFPWYLHTNSNYRKYLSTKKWLYYCKIKLHLINTLMHDGRYIYLETFLCRNFWKSTVFIIFNSVFFCSWSLMLKQHFVLFKKSDWYSLLRDFLVQTFKNSFFSESYRH